MKSEANFIFASNKNLDDAEVRNNLEFPDDFYHRISTFTSIKIPPLRERITDIPFIIYKIVYELTKNNYPQYFTNDKQFSQIFPVDEIPTFGVPGMSNHLIQGFMFDRWDGNGRELRHTLEFIWDLEHEGMLTGQIYFSRKGINLYQYLYKVSGGKPVQVKDFSPKSPGYHNPYYSLGFPIEHLNNLDVRDIISKPDLLPKEVLDLLAGVKIRRLTYDLKYFAQNRWNIKDILALYCYEVEKDKKGETKTERAEQIGLTFPTYDKHLKRGENLKSTFL